ncbi:MAG: DUF1338 domain-containing protein [Kofleriaceae bacterium]
MTVAALFEALWADYVRMTPQAERIHRLLGARGEEVQNDHVALRTFGVPGIDLAALARPFEAVGYQPRDAYRFADKKLDARYWQHPDASLPKIFISELRVGELTPATQRRIAALVAQLPPGFGTRADLPWAGRPWQCTAGDYHALLAESEYAAWMAAFGFRVNHFTVSVNALTTFASLAELDAFLVAEGFVLNTAGGTIKGTPADRLEQSSTRADTIAVDLAGEVVQLPSCYYEFAKRYPLPTGELFHGFVPASADKIFESTDVTPG